MNAFVVLMQRTFVGVDAFTVFQETVLRATEDPRVNNVVNFSEAIGEFKVGGMIILMSWWH